MKIGMRRTRNRFFVGLLFLIALVVLPIASQAATIVADFNGDGVNDTATITAGSGTVRIARGGGLGTGIYNTNADWLTFHSVNSNGVVGQELVATFANGLVSVIDDRAKAARIYNVYGTSGAGQRILFFKELNGAAGTEILFVYANSLVSVVDDRLHAVRNYNVFGVGFGGPTRYFNLAEFNGVSGDEIMFSYMNGTSQVIDDRRRAVRTYNYFTNGAAPTYANVDGVAGLEAIFTYGAAKVRLTDRTGQVTYHY